MCRNEGCGRVEVMGHQGKVTMLMTLVAALTALSGCATQTYVALETGRLASSADAAKSLVVGEGRYAYQFTLIDPHTGKPWPNHPYALTTGLHNHYHLPFVADPKNVYQGVSDGEGKTALFRLPVKISDRDWDLRERFGSGPNGETFRLKDASTGKPLADFPYLLMICSTPPQYHIGYSYPNGDTAYSASDKPERITLSEGGSYDEDDLPKSCDEPDDAQPTSDDVKPMAPFAAGGTAPHAAGAASDPGAPADKSPPAALAAVSAQEIGASHLFDLLSGGEAALGAKNYAKAKAMLEAADGELVVMERRYSHAINGFPSALGHADLDLKIGRAIGEGRLGDPCPRFQTSLAAAKKAMAIASGHVDAAIDSATERRNYTVALSSAGFASDALKKYSCVVQERSEMLDPPQPELSPRPAPTAATEPSKDLQRNLMELMKRGDDALQVKDYATARNLFEQADVIITKHDSEFMGFAGYFGRAELQIHLATAIGDGKLGDPCRAITRSREWAAKAKLETYDDGETERRDEADALMGRIEGEAKRLSCPTRAAIDFPKATATPEQGTPEERVIDLSTKGTESYLAKDYPNASRFFQQVQEIIDENPSAFTSFASMMGRTNTALYRARVASEGQLGGECALVDESRMLLAQAKQLAVGQQAALQLAYVDGEKIKIDEVAATYGCKTWVKGKAVGE
jgi:hypothetical protein